MKWTVIQTGRTVTAVQDSQTVMQTGMAVSQTGIVEKKQTNFLMWTLRGRTERIL